MDLATILSLCGGGLVLGLIALGLWYARQYGKTEVEKDEAQKTVKAQSDQLSIAAKPGRTPDQLLERMRDGDL